MDVHKDKMWDGYKSSSWPKNLQPAQQKIKYVIVVICISKLTWHLSSILSQITLLGPKLLGFSIQHTEVGGAHWIFVVLSWKQINQIKTIIISK